MRHILNIFKQQEILDPEMSLAAKAELSKQQRHKDGDWIHESVLLRYCLAVVYNGIVARLIHVASQGIQADRRIQTAHAGNRSVSPVSRLDSTCKSSASCM